MANLAGRRLSVCHQVYQALAHKLPVVALESTIITHGMPFPENIKTAQEVERIVEDSGCQPATIAVHGGHAVVGLSTRELQMIASAPNPVKASIRDIAIGLAKGWTCGTTVAATAYIASMAGIRVFATGGIGGVHRGVTETWDVSCDLRTLGRVPVAVVCAGVKSFLDVGKTLEYLETEGVPVVTFGKSRSFPGFYSPDSGFKSPYHTNDIKELSDMVRRHFEICPGVGMLIATPIPSKHAANASVIQKAIDDALAQASEEGVKGRDVTPFVLKQLIEGTDGEALRTNVELIKNNASVAARLAVQLADSPGNSSPCAQLPKEDTPANVQAAVYCNVAGGTRFEREAHTSEPRGGGSVVLLGGIVFDSYASTEMETVQDGTSYPGRIVQYPGGVARNMADAMTRIARAQDGLALPTLVSAVGDDIQGRAIKEECAHMDLTYITMLEGRRTASYSGFVGHDKQLMFGIMDAEIFDVVAGLEMISKSEHLISSSSLLVMDANYPTALLKRACEIASNAGTKVWFEPTDKLKASKLISADLAKHANYLSPNWNELNAILGADMNFGFGRTPRVLAVTDNFADTDEWLLEVKPQLLQLLNKVPNLKVALITLGSKGVLVVHDQHESDGTVVEYYPAMSRPEWVSAQGVNPSGSGDCLNAGFIHNHLVRGKCVGQGVALGSACARASLASEQPVPWDLADHVALWANVNVMPLLRERL